MTRSNTVSTIEEILPIAEALTGKEVVRHPDIDVNIPVVCRICDILTLMDLDTPYNYEQFKVCNI